MFGLLRRPIGWTGPCECTPRMRRCARSCGVAQKRRRGTDQRGLWQGREPTRCCGRESDPSFCFFGLRSRIGHLDARSGAGAGAGAAAGLFVPRNDGPFGGGGGISGGCFRSFAGFITSAAPAWTWAVLSFRTVLCCRRRGFPTQHSMGRGGMAAPLSSAHDPFTTAQNAVSRHRGGVCVAPPLLRLQTPRPVVWRRGRAGVVVAGHIVGHCIPRLLHPVHARCASQAPVALS